MSVPFVVVSDFDGTITEQDLVVQLTTWANPANRAVVERINRRELDLKAGLETLFGNLPSGQRPAYQTFLQENATFRAGFHRFRSVLNESRIPFYIVSNGLDFIVDAALGPVAHDHQRILNQARFDGPTISIRWQYPCAPPCPGGCGLCKHAVVADLRERHQAPVVFIGDGVTDYNGARNADQVFARSRLAAYLTEMGHPFTPFDTFDDVLFQLFSFVRGDA